MTEGIFTLLLPPGISFRFRNCNFARVINGTLAVRPNKFPKRLEEMQGGAPIKMESYQPRF